MRGTHTTKETNKVGRRGREVLREGKERGERKGKVPHEEELREGRKERGMQ